MKNKASSELFLFNLCPKVVQILLALTLRRLGASRKTTITAVGTDHLAVNFSSLVNPNSTPE
jgi:hypothetical protein